MASIDEYVGIYHYGGLDVWICLKVGILSMVFLVREIMIDQWIIRKFLDRPISNTGHGGN